MAKISFTKLGLKKLDLTNTVKIWEQEVEVKEYLPVNDKLELIGRVIMGAHDENNFPNPIKIEVIALLEIISAYTNITFTEKQKESPNKLYDLLVENEIDKIILEAIPDEEYEFLMNGIYDTIDAIYTFENSALGILESVKTDYSNLDLDVEKLAKNLQNGDNIELVKDILTKLG